MLVKSMLLIGTAMTAATGTVAFAQADDQAAQTGPAEDQAPAPAQAAQPQVASGDIVVTARRVSESLSKVPVAVTAFGAEQLTARAIVGETDLQRSFTGLTVRSGQTNNQISFSIRGQSIDPFTGSQPGVLPYFNEVQLSSFSTSSFYDLESIQTLKGPQGTLFGRNATGGAVLFTTAKPKDEFGGFVTARIGNLDLRQVQGAINIPIVEDKVLLRIAGDFSRRDGFQYNVYQDVSHGKQRRESGRISLTLKPTDRLTNDTVFQYSHAGGDNLQLENFSSYACGRAGVYSLAACTFGPIGLTPEGYAAYQAFHPLAKDFPNGFIDQAAYQKKLGLYKVNSIQPSFHKATDWFVTNATTFELTDDIKIKNIFGYGKSKSHDNYDPVGGGPFYLEGQTVSLGGPNDPLFSRDPLGAWNRARDISEEFQIIGKTGGLDYIVGVYYSNSTKGFYAPVSFFELQPLAPTAVQINDFQTKDVSKAIYAQLTQDLGGLTGLDGLSLTGGFRYTWEKFTLRQGPDATQMLFVDSPINPADPVESVKNKKPSWNISINYQVNPSLLLYAAQRGSWRTGGFNGQGPARALYAGEGGNLFKPETTYDFEVGMKLNTRVQGMPLRANLALYSQTIKNVQRAVYTTPPPAYAVGGVSALQALTVNIPKARVKGVEFDFAVNPTDWLELGGSLTYTDAKFLNGQTRLFGGDVVYGTYADTPKWAGTFYGAVTLPVSEKVGKMVLRGDVYSQSGQWFTNLGTTLTPETYLPKYTLVNGRFDWTIGSTPITVSAFVKNLTKKGYYTGGIALVPFGANGAIPGEPRTYGLEATVKF